MPKKLIEVALPLEAINREAAREKSLRHGHPSTLHLWWARRPLAACRAVLLATLLDDPSSHPAQFPTVAAQNAERQRLFQLIAELVKWESSNDPRLLAAVQAEIQRSCGTTPPPILDPFCGGGSIPLEAQRLGLAAYGSDLNPVAVMVTKALIELPLRFTEHPPVNPQARRELSYSASWQRATGLACDVRYYGQWMYERAVERIGHLYPKVSYDNTEATVIAWLWARTIECPNPACRARIPLVTSFVLAAKKQDKVWLEPQIDRQTKDISFEVRRGRGEVVVPKAPKVGRGASFQCLVCEQPAEESWVHTEFQNKHNREQLLAVVAESRSGRVYLPADARQVTIANSAQPEWYPLQEMNPDSSNLVSGRGYGIKYWHELFTARQLVALTTFSDLVAEARQQVLADALVAGLAADELGVDSCGQGAVAYADTVATYLAFAVDRLANRASRVCIWNTIGEKVEQTFARQAVPMTWDFAEANVLGNSTGSWLSSLEWIPLVLESVPATGYGKACQQSAVELQPWPVPPIISTDPPYYDNIGYAELADFFYIWLRRAIGTIYPTIFSTMLVPKAQELTATTYRFAGDKAKAKEFFEEQLAIVFRQLRQLQAPDYPLTIYYAFKQTEADKHVETKHLATDEHHTKSTAISSTGWETMLEALVRAGFTITGTWPIHTERPTGVKASVNALASSIVLVCRSRAADAPWTTRRDFLNALKRELPEAVKQLQAGGIAPVDLAQAAIGPGMAIYSRYQQVMESDGSTLPVRTALMLINQALDEYFVAEQGQFDADTRWACAWFEQYGLEGGPYGTAEILSKAKNTGLEGLRRAGILEARGGKVRLLMRAELPANWQPTTEKRLTVWAITQHLIRVLAQDGEVAAARLLWQVEIIDPQLVEPARDLAYRLYAICERKKWANEAMAYNRLVQSWWAIMPLVAQLRRTDQMELFG
jgi:putative DNA methylase